MNQCSPVFSISVQVLRVLLDMVAPRQLELVQAKMLMNLGVGPALLYQGLVALAPAPQLEAYLEVPFPASAQRIRCRFPPSRNKNKLLLQH